MKKVSRRDFIKTGSIAAAGISISAEKITGAGDQAWSVKVGVIGTGYRGTSHVSNLLTIEGVEIIAVCDLFEDRAKNAASICKKNGRKPPAVYFGDMNVYKKMLDKTDLDAVIIATYWDSHSSIAVHAMEHKIYPGIEVPAALTVDDTWKLVEISEKTGIPCMMLENWSFRQDNLALLNIKRLGMLGEIVHCHCAHSHDCIDHWFFDSKTGFDRWPADYLRKYNRDQYPTHTVSPVMSWLDINQRDAFEEIYSRASAS